MSTHSSISDTASEIDPYLRTIGLATPDSGFKSSPADSLVELSRPVVTFPLPPRRRLRPGDIVTTSYPQDSSIKPTSHIHEPVALYGVAIGGENRRTPAGISGRAQVKKDRYSSAYMHNKRPSSAARSSPNTPIHADGQTAGIRARNPSHYLARNTQSSLSDNVNFIKPDNAPLPSSATDPSSALSSDRLGLPKRPHRTDSLISFPSEVNLALPPGFPGSCHQGAPHLYQNGRSPSRNDDPVNDNCTNLDLQHAARLNALNQALQIDDNPVEKTGMSYPQRANQQASHSNSISRKHDASITSVQRIRFAPPPRKSLIRVTTSTFPTLLRTANEVSKKPPKTRNKLGWKRILFPQPKAKTTSRPAISLPLSDSFLVTASGTLPTTPKHHEPRSPFNHSELQSPGTQLTSLPISMSQHASSDILAGRAYAFPQAQSESQALQAARPRPRSRSFSGLNNTYQTYPRPPGSIPLSYYENVGYHHPESSLSTSNPLMILPALGPQCSLPHASTSHPPSTQPRQGQPGSNTFIEHFPQTRPSAELHVDSLPATNQKKSVRFRRTLELIPDPSFLASLSPCLDERSMSHGSKPLKSSADRPGTGYERNNSIYNSRGCPTGAPQQSPYRPAPSGFTHHCESTATQKQNNNQITKAKLGMGMKLLMRATRRNSDETSLSFSLKSENGSIKNSSQLEIPMTSEPRESAVGKAHHDLTTKRTRDNDTVEDADFDLLKRTLAPKLNLTFVDLDHHIGSRFSVNTLFKEVQKAIPEISPLDISKLPPENSLCPRAQTSPSASHAHARSQSTSCLNSHVIHGPAISHNGRTHTRTQTVPNASSNVKVPQATSNDFRLSRPRTRPKLQVQRASKVVHENENRPICESVEVVQAEGRELTFEMVVPNSHLSSRSHSPAPRFHTDIGSQSKVSKTAEQSSKDCVENYENELKKMSDRLVALDNSLEASQTKNTPNNVQPAIPAQKKLERVETWLSSVPPSAVSVIISPGGQNIHHRPLDWPLGDEGEDSPISAISSEALQPTSDYDETERWQEDFPESPIDRCAIPICLARSGSKTKATLVLKTSNVHKTTLEKGLNGRGQLTQSPASNLGTFKLDLPPLKNKIDPASMEFKKDDSNPTGLVRVRAPSDSSSGTSIAATRIPKVTQMVAIHERPKSSCRARDSGII